MKVFHRICGIMFSMEYVEFSFRQNMWNSDFHKICELQFLHIPQIMWNTFALQWMEIRFPWFPQNLGNSVFYNFHRFYGNPFSTFSTKSWDYFFTYSTNSVEFNFPRIFGKHISTFSTKSGDFPNNLKKISFQWNLIQIEF